ncbi:MAG: transcription-repair coupling factor [Bacilli bacterium]|nr:transcription-repair coupling factor [Bacilli bacterium]
MDLFKKMHSNLKIPPLEKSSGLFVVDNDIGVSLLISHFYKENTQNLLIVTSNLYKSQRIYNAITAFVPSKDVVLFPCDELIRAETLSQSKEMTAQRIFGLSKIIKKEARIVIANLSSSTRFLPKPELFTSKIVNLKVGDVVDISNLKRQLLSMGYQRVSKIDQSLEFATRGDIIDIFSVNHDTPIRIEFFGDEIDSIRYFDIATQSSVSKVDSVEILPSSDIILSDDDYKNCIEKLYSALEKDKTRLDPVTFDELRISLDNIVNKLSECNFDETLYKYYSLLNSNVGSIFDYCKDYKAFFVDKDGLLEANRILQNESTGFLGELFETGKALSALEMYASLEEVINFRSKNVIYTSQFIDKDYSFSFDVKPVYYVSSKKEDAINIVSNYLNQNLKVVVCLTKAEQIMLIEQEFDSFNIPYEKVKDLDIPEKFNVGVSCFDLPSGFVLNDLNVVYISGNELFSEKTRTSRLDNRFKEATILKSFEDLEPGDYVVHEYQGIGQFVGLETIETNGIHNDYLKISYWGNETLYVPLNQFQLVRKYLGKEGMVPRLSHLHSNDWENTKKRVKERINNLAERLMQLYIQRSKVRGFAFSKDDEFQEKFEEHFEHNLTYDQNKAIQEIKKDMEAETPMDRLLCGDVGFGKTEVAMRAAFKAINSGKQVAILCPTTLLARQHYELSCKRFAGFDIKIGILSRLVPEREQKIYLEKLEEGSLHLIIGTHRLLSKQTHFKDLGLLIIDEEQRFGVEQKEKIKELKNNIDVLALSATPIPRTLQISLLGVRAMSKIDTPPHERMPIQTYVSPFKLEVAKELIERELGRNGQVFFLHNNVSTLATRANSIHRLIPDARIGIAHGQMDRDEIEDVMLKFYNGEIDILVCTSIVENGIDVPNANMIIVEDSEKYGLSQLYQIKGRVGRSNRIAYAYLMYSPYKQLNEKAQKRLKALQDFSELGSGYKIAQRDLLIRGAGDILGPEQAGFIDSIGLDMYIKLLNESIKEKMEGVKPDVVTFNPNLSLDAYIPSSFANDQEKIELYQEIMSSPSREALARTKNRTKDMYGKLPNEVETLFIKRDIDLLSEEADVQNINETRNIVEVILGNKYINIRGIGNLIFEAMIPYLKFIKISYSNNVFKIQMNKTNDWIKNLENVLLSLSNILEHNKTIEVV